MAFGVCPVGLVSLLKGKIQDTDEFKMALYGKRAQVSADTAKYTTRGEVRGPGYEAGGKRIGGYVAKFVDGNVVITFNEPVDWTSVTLEVWKTLIYVPSKDNLALFCVEPENPPLRPQEGRLRIWAPSVEEGGLLYIRIRPRGT